MVILFFFSKIGLVNAYYQIPIEHADVPKTGIIIPFGLITFLKMSFDLRNAVNAFQGFTDKSHLLFRLYIHLYQQLFDCQTNRRKTRTVFVTILY